MQIQPNRKLILYILVPLSKTINDGLDVYRPETYSRD